MEGRRWNRASRGLHHQRENSIKRDRMKGQSIVSKVGSYLCAAAVLSVPLYHQAFKILNVKEVSAQVVDEAEEETNLLRVVTVRNYSYSDSNHTMDIKVPKVLDPQCSEAVEKINQDVDERTNVLADQFYHELESVGNKGYGAIFVDYKVPMNRENWFTLELEVNRISGSSDTYYKIYNMDRNTGRIVFFSDLFCTSDFKNTIQRNILKQMKKQMQDDRTLVYNVDEENLWQLSDNQNYYFNENGELVIQFNKYEVAPGSMGTPKFTIEKDTLHHILKQEYQDIVF